VGYPGLHHTTYASHMVPIMAGMLGLPCRPCSGPLQLIADDYFFIYANLGVRSCHICISGYALPFFDADFCT
jgi:hypothetical protein